MTDYTWPSVYFSYLFFAISAGVAVFFFIRSLRDGYWGKHGEDVKYSVFEDSAATSNERSSRPIEAAAASRIQQGASHGNR